MAKQFKIRPSQIIQLNNDYESFCFDEACTLILSHLNSEKNNKPKFEDEKPKNNKDVIEYLNNFN